MKSKVLYFVVIFIVLFIASCAPSKEDHSTSQLIDTSPEKTESVNTELPKVLIIGDSISIGYTKPTQEMLAGKADVTRIAGNGQDTANGLAKINEWLSVDDWDVIHFNWGLWDLCYRHPESEAYGNRDKIRGTLTATLEQYEDNLRELVRILKESQAKLIWAGTTTVPEGEAGRIKGDELKYNVVAEKIMRENGITVNDLHSYLLPRVEEFQVREGDVHLTEEGYRYLAKQVAEYILNEIEK